MRTHGDDTTDRTALAAEVIETAVSEVVARAPYLGGARALLEVCPRPGALLACDGTTLAYDVEAVLARLAATKALPSREVAHVLTHCVLLHVFPAPDTGRRSWSLAADVVAEGIADELFGEDNSARGQTQRAIREQMSYDIGEPQSLVRVFDALSRGLWENMVDSWSASFAVDDHRVWFEDDDGADGAGGEGAMAHGTHSPHDARARHHEGEERPARDHATDQRRQRTRERWNELARRAASELRGRGHDHTGGPGSLVREIELAPRVTLDLTQFLARFCHLHQTTIPTDAAYDPIFYTYGLELYGNLPLIEPLEEHEEQGVCCLVIALDTSASVGGEAMRAFCALATELMRSTRALSAKSCVRIIQADAKVQSDTVIKSDADLDRWRRDVKIVGFGGTDFRPTFAHVDELLKNGVVDEVDGLVYLTDGAGVYPKEAPTYPVAFVLTDDAADIPSWALRHRTTHTEIMSLARHMEEPS